VGITWRGWMIGFHQTRSSHLPERAGRRYRHLRIHRDRPRPTQKTHVDAALVRGERPDHVSTTSNSTAAADVLTASFHVYVMEVAPTPSSFYIDTSSMIRSTAAPDYPMMTLLSLYENARAAGLVRSTRAPVIRNTFDSTTPSPYQKPPTLPYKIEAETATRWGVGRPAPQASSARSVAVSCGSSRGGVKGKVNKKKGRKKKGKRKNKKDKKRKGKRSGGLHPRFPHGVGPRCRDLSPDRELRAGENRNIRVS